MRVCFVSLSRIADDPRIRRHGDALAQAGWDVRGIGAAGATSPAPSWPVVELPLPERAETGTAGRAVRLAASRWSERRALRTYWSSATASLLARAVVDSRPDVVVANDWSVLPACARAAESLAASLVYDSHEYGAGEHVERWRWRLLYPPYVRALERQGTREADLVMTVGAGIARLLEGDLALPVEPTVIRNTPPYRSTAFRPTGRPVEVLYHGIFKPGRGLEALIAAAALWGEGATLVLRGLGAEAYVAELEDLARRLPAGRVRLEPAVPPGDLVTAAARSDVGIFTMPGTSAQTRLCLPNKFFEYAMAGLALVVSDLPEMSSLVRQHDLGVVVEDTTPAGIAAVVASLDRGRIDHWKRQSLATARLLAWEVEARRLVEAFEPLRRRSSSSASPTPGH